MVNDDDSYDNNFMLVLTFTASMSADDCDHGMKNDKRLDERIPSHFSLFLSLNVRG